MADSLVYMITVGTPEERVEEFNPASTGGRLAVQSPGMASHLVLVDSGNFSTTKIPESLR